MSQPTRTKGRSCDGKERHDTREAAKGNIARLAKRGAAFGRLEAYRCDFCGSWHVGHTSRRKR